MVELFEELFLMAAAPATLGSVPRCRPQFESLSDRPPSSQRRAIGSASHALANPCNGVMANRLCLALATPLALAPTIVPMGVSMRTTTASS